MDQNSHQAQSGYEIFQKESPQIAEAFNRFIGTLSAPSALDPKTKNLLYIAMKIVTGDLGAVYAHVPMAKKLGATREEIRETVLLTLAVIGLKGVNTCLTQALDVYDKAQ